METIVQFLARNDAFMVRGQRHIVKHVIRKGKEREVLVIGETDEGRYWEATFDWGDTVDTLDGVGANGVHLASVAFELR